MTRASRRYARLTEKPQRVPLGGLQRHRKAVRVACLDALRSELPAIRRANARLQPALAMGAGR